MNYEKIYHSIIDNRKKNPIIGYTEEHHIIPRCIGGNNMASNLVKLTAREHFICHLLLTKIYLNTPEYYKLVKAFLMMLVESPTHKRYNLSRRYEKLRLAFARAQSIEQSGELNSQFGTRWVHNPILKISKKVAKNSLLEPGWVEGRVIKFDRVEVEKECPNCNKKISGKVFCSLSCSASWHSNQRKGKTKLEQKIEDIIKDVTNGAPISNTLTAYGMCGTGDNYKKVKEELIRRGLV